MPNLEILHFEQLKNEIQTQYLKNHTPSNENISLWKGIDIIYFQEDLRKKAKGNISEKTFYTYFKTTPITKVPRIDMLNILSIYAGYASWFDFKKNHLFANEILDENENLFIETAEIDENSETLVENPRKFEVSPQNSSADSEKSEVLQNKYTVNQPIKEKSEILENKKKNDFSKQKKSIKNYVWAGSTAILALLTTFLGFGDKIFDKDFTYCFIDADRNAPIQNTLEIKVIKEDESPIYYRINAGECFQYGTKDKILKMEISSPLYENLEISRNLEDAPEEEKIQLKPDDYKTAVYYFSKKEISGNPDLIKQKRVELESRISNNAVIYQVFDNDVYGIETMDKQKYITLVTTPTTSLKNLSVIEMKRDKGKIVSIKFKIKDDDENP